MPNVEGLYRQIDPEIEPFIRNDLKALTRLVRITSSEAKSWKETEIRLVKSNPWRSQYRQIQVTHALTNSTIEKLRIKTIFILWYRLKNLGFEDEVNKIIGRSSQPVIEYDKLLEMDTYINSVKDNLD